MWLFRCAHVMWRDDIHSSGGEKLGSGVAGFRTNGSGTWCYVDQYHVFCRLIF